MILNLTIERQGLPPARIRWNTQSFTATHSAVSTDPTIAQLVEQVNEVIPIEGGTWGFEDYAVEVNGFECLHFCRVSQVLKDEGHVTIRPWQTQEVRFRSISGRQQISADGRHLIDGVSFGRPFLRRAWRPPVRIQPKKRATQNLEYDQDGEDADEPAGYLMPAQPNQSVEPEDEQMGGLVNGQVGQNEPYQILSNIPGRSSGQGGQPLKRRLEPGFEDAREGKRVRSALQPAISHGSRDSSANSKSVRFQGIASNLSETMPSAIQGPFDSDDSDDDDDFDPQDDSSEDDSDVDANKENFDPEKQEYSDPHPSSQADDEQAAPTLAELPLKQRTSLDSSSLSSSEPPSDDDSVDTSDDSEDGEDTSDISSSEDSSDDSSDEESSSGSDASKAAPDLSTREAYVKTSQAKVPTMTPYGGGKVETTRRNQRRREANKLVKLKENGVLPSNATLEDMRRWQAQNTKKDEFESSRQALLDAISNGGVDVTASISGSGKATERSAPNAQIQTDAVPTQAQSANGQGPEVDQNVTNPSQSTVTGAATQNEPTPATGTEKSPPKRRKIDLGASARMLLGGLGLRAPKSKEDADKMREQSRQESQKNFEKHQKRQQQEIEAQAVIDENWQDHIELKSVECADPSIQYSTPPFPFVQRWDPQQHFNNWRPRDGRKKRQGRKDTHQQVEIEEHYDAAMYDDPPYEEEAEAMEVDAEPIIEKEQQPPLDVSDKVDLLLEQALVGAKIAFKQLVLSAATEWQPIVSEYKSATVMSNDAGVLLLSLDEHYREQKEIDPGTGEVVASNFIITDDQDQEDDGILDIPYGDLIEPKLLLAAVTPMASQESADPSQSMNAIDAIANGVEASTKTSISNTVGASTKTSMSTTVEVETQVDEGDETAVETSFNASTRTEVELNGHPARALDIDPNARDEASMLIREAGFRSGIDPEATRPLDSEQSYPQLGPSSERGTRSQTDFKGSSSSGPEPLDDDEDESNPMFVPQVKEYTRKLFTTITDADNQSNGARNLASDDIDLGINDAFSSIANGQAASQQVDIVSLHDSSQEMVTEAMPDTLEDVEPSSPASVIQSPVKSVNLVDQIDTGGRNLGRSLDSPEAAPISVEDVEEVEAFDDFNNDLPTWDGEIDGGRSPPPPRKVKTSASSQSARSNSRKSDRRAISLSQPDPVRNTRRAARRASAMANPITLSSDDEDDVPQPNVPDSPPPSTAPAQYGFKPINVRLPSASQPAPNKRHTTNTVDLTQLVSDSIDLSEDDEEPEGRRVFTSTAASKKGPKKPVRSSEGVPRTKSTV